MAVPLDCGAATDRVVILFLFFSFVQNVINYTYCLIIRADIIYVNSIYYLNNYNISQIIVLYSCYCENNIHTFYSLHMF